MTLLTVRLVRHCGVYGVVGALGIGVAVFAMTSARASQTTDPLARETTVMMLKVDSDRALPIHTTFTEQPPAITVIFPETRVVAAVPERFTVGHGVIRAIEARYHRPVTRGQGSPRFLHAVRVVLTAPYPYRARSEPGRVFIEVEHPASLSRASLEVGLRGGTIVGTPLPLPVSRRFHAMQVALERATPPHLFSDEPVGGSAFTRSSITDASHPRGREMTHPVGTSGAPTARAGISSASVLLPVPVRRMTTATALWLFGLLGCVMAIGVGLRLRRPTDRHPSALLERPPSRWSRHTGREGIRPRHPASRDPQLGRWLRRFVTTPALGGVREDRFSSSLMLVDQLVWRGVESQGYQLCSEQELTQPPLGLLRVIERAGAKAALLFVGQGRVLERHTVEQFLARMREANVESQGFLVTAGAFTVPAQRFAKSHGITLIGREALIELLGLGSKSETVTKQLAQLQGHLVESQERVSQAIAECDALRRQRNEATWALGEARAASASREAQVEALTQQLTRHEADVTRWEHEASTWRAQWEESQWYLGESRERLSALEAEVRELLVLSQQLEQLQRERDEARWFLGEARARCAALQQHVQALTGQPCEALGDGAQARSEDRRASQRIKIHQATIEFLGQVDGQAVAASLRDLSRTGIGFDSDHPLTGSSTFRLRIAIPGDEPIESMAERLWQQSTNDASGRFSSGCRWLDLPETTRARLDALLASSPAL